MGLGEKKGAKFGTASNRTVKPYTPEYFAALIVKACKQEGMTPTVKLVSEGLGTIEAEGGFTPALWRTQQAKGPWGEEPEFQNGTEAEHLDPWRSTLLAIRQRKQDGSFYNAWWQWEDKQGEVEDGKARAHKYIKIAEAAGAGGSNPSLGEELPLIGGAVGTAEEIVGGAAEATLGAGEFLAELAATVLDFRKLGTLAAHAMAWFLRLILKAIWDFVIAPMIHWAERAETFYFRNFFGTGQEKGSGVGYQLRANAAIITIGFWALGYAVLWSDGEVLSPVAPHESLLGQSVKGIEGKIARRNLVKPSDVDRETPDKPEPKSSTVTIERTKELSVQRNRPVKVGTPGGSEDLTGRKNNERSVGRIPRPGSTQQISQQQTQTGTTPESVNPAGGGPQTQSSEQAKIQKATAAGGPRPGPRTGGGNGPQGGPVAS